MRAMILAASIAAFVYAAAGERMFGEWRVDAAVERDARISYELRCNGLPAGQRDECQRELSSKFASGELTPQAILRQHCTRFDNVWSDATLPAPPDVCTARFGGWLSS